MIFPSGIGISLRREHYDDVLRTTRRIDWLEIQPENFMGIGGWVPAFLDQCRERWTIVPHGVALSLGGPEPPSEDYLVPLSHLMQRIDAPYFSEHACYSAIDGMAFHELLPLPFSAEAARHLGRRARWMQERLGAPFVLENITYYAAMPGSEMTEGAFLRAVFDENDCGLLLDVNNVYVNAINHGRRPLDVLDELPVHRTRQIHLAGHIREGDLLIDNHGAAVCDEVWELYREVIARLGPVPTLLEWETALPSLDRVLDEADRARAILEAATPRISGG
jgi:uncharacterized protein